MAVTPYNQIFNISFQALEEYFKVYKPGGGPLAATQKGDHQKRYFEFFQKLQRAYSCLIIPYI